MRQKRPSIRQKRPTNTSIPELPTSSAAAALACVCAPPEVCVSVKSGLTQEEKRRETYNPVQRDPRTLAYLRLPRTGGGVGGARGAKLLEHTRWTVPCARPAAPLAARRSTPSCARPHARMRTCQKRPTYMAKETYLYGKRDLPIWQKRPTSTGIPVLAHAHVPRFRV